MIAVTFEVIPAAGRRRAYLDLAASLRQELKQIDGFVSIERFASLTTAGKILVVFRLSRLLDAYERVLNM